MNAARAMVVQMIEGPERVAGSPEGVLAATEPTDVRSARNPVFPYGSIARRRCLRGRAVAGLSPRARMGDLLCGPTKTTEVARTQGPCPSVRAGHLLH